MHMLGPDPFSACFCLYIYLKVIQSARDHMLMELKYIEEAFERALNSLQA